METFGFLTGAPLAIEARPLHPPERRHRKMPVHFRRRLSNGAIYGEEKESPIAQLLEAVSSSSGATYHGNSPQTQKHENAIYWAQEVICLPLFPPEETQSNLMDDVIDCCGEDVGPPPASRISVSCGRADAKYWPASCRV